MGAQKSPQSNGTQKKKALVTRGKIKWLEKCTRPDISFGKALLLGEGEVSSKVEMSLGSQEIRKQINISSPYSHKKEQNNQKTKTSKQQNQLVSYILENEKLPPQNPHIYKLLAIHELNFELKNLRSHSNKTYSLCPHQIFFISDRPGKSLMNGLSVQIYL